MAGSLLFVWSNYRAAFPQASLDLKLPRQEITRRAETFLRGRGLEPAKYRNLTLFDPDDDARLFLERELGLTEANRLMSSSVAVWRWRARWFRPPDKEEYRAYLAPDGRLVAFDHIVDEAAPGERLSPEDALRKAEEFLRSQTSLAHKLVLKQRTERPKRDDHEFIWEQEGFRPAGGSYRRHLVVQGGEVASYAEYLEAPEQWQRDFAAARARNELLARAAQALFAVLIVCALVLAVRAMRRRDVQWRPLLLVSAAVGMAMTLNLWNGLPFSLDRMPTNSTVPMSTLLAILSALGAGAGTFLYLAAAGAPGEVLYRRFQPSKLSLAAVFSGRALRTREFFWSCLEGYGFAALHMVFLTAFYMVTNRLGGWSPQDVTYSDMLSTALPWLYPMSISLFAGFTEEFWFRLLAIPLLKRWTGSTAVAVLLPAFVWGFLHANYPQQPAYIRGLEVGLIGVGAGLLLLRRGIVATLVWHYTIDAALIGTFLLASSGWYERFSGALVAGAVILPWGFAVYSYRRNGFLEDPALLNSAIPEPPEPVPQPEPEPLEPLAPVWPRKWLWIAGAVMAVVAVAARGGPIGSYIRVTLDREQAIRAAGEPPAGYLTSAEFISNLQAPLVEYLRRQAGRTEAERIVRDYTHTGVWRVRWFADSKAEEWYRFVDSGGKVYRVDHTLEETASGANLPLEQAAPLAGKHLRANGIDPKPLQLVDASSEKLENRTDHHFEWTDPTMDVGEAEARVSLNVVGDEISAFRRYIKLPEAFLRDYESPRFQGYLLPALIGGASLLVLVVVLRNLAHTRLDWVAIGGCAAAVLVLSVAEHLNRLPSRYSEYDTTQPLALFVSDQWVSFFQYTLLLSLLAAAMALVLSVLLRVAQGERRLPPVSAWNVIAMTTIVAGLARLASSVEPWTPGDRVGAPLWTIHGLGSWSPALDAVIPSITGALFGTLATGIVGCAAAALFGGKGRLGFAITAVLLAAGAQSISAGQFVYHAVFIGLAVGALAFAARTAGPDLLSLAGALFLAQCLSRAAPLVDQPSASISRQGVIALVMAAVLAAVWLRWFSAISSVARTAARRVRPVSAVSANQG